MKTIINVLQYLEQSREKYPNKIVFACQESQINYSELVVQARAIGSYLLGITDSSKNKPVVVFINRDISSLVSFMGVAYSNNFYAPIDVQLPLNRIALMFKTLQPVAVIVLRKDLELLDELDFTGHVVIFEDAITCKIDDFQLRKVRIGSIDTDPLYAIFTSGSTGIPKGVIISHRSVIDLIEHFTEIFNFSAKSIFGNQAQFDFDVSVKDIYSTLKNGATMHIIPKAFYSFPVDLIKFLNSRRINTVIWATSALRIIANLKSLEKEIPGTLKKIMFSGEVMPNKVLNYWRKYLPDALYVNLYGPTEITCNCTYYIVNREFKDQELLPIGIPFPNSDILVLNETNQPIEFNEIGELCVRGSSLALGYYNNPIEQSRAFCQNPVNIYYPELIYRTGDLVKYNEFNELIYLSRRDNQIKHMGYRIELGEIELVVNALHYVDCACCIYSSEDERIVLFYQSAQNVDKKIILDLRDFLPKYMVPNKFIHLEKIPMNKNSKIDRVLLKEKYIVNSSK